MRIHGEGYRWAAPGTVSEAFCAVCGDTCAIRRNVLGPTCFAEAMAKRPRLHDAITCPNGDAEWHRRASRLREAIAESPSPSVAALMDRDLAAILGRRAAGT